MAAEDCTQKRCTKCGEVKPLSEYHADKRTFDGKRSDCKLCKKAVDKSFNSRNHDAVIQRNRNYYAANREAIKKYERDKWHKNKEKRIAQNREWCKRNAEHVKAKKLAYSRKNKAKVCAWMSKRRARKIGAEGSYTDGDISKLYHLQRGHCACCKCSLKSGYQIDHVMPLALGGSNWPSNLQLLCRFCNQSKGAKHPIEFMKKNGMLL